MEKTLHSINTEKELFELGEGKKITVLLFGAPWNQGTRLMEDILEQILQNHEDYGIGYSNVEDNQSLAIKYGITSFPALTFFSSKGEVIGGASGVLSNQALENKFSEALLIGK
jgi:thioredoxin-like negative regulator of GroEL